MWAEMACLTSLIPVTQQPELMAAVWFLVTNLGREWEYIATLNWQHYKKELYFCEDVCTISSA